ncbi:uncharacterized protein RMCC_1362 [Mycolicibacterium canariasense]|uniref:Holliday junction nuclease RuvC n=1 Tax=Mycolicibacterium canariasense TaxID=228230 RepID=A0A100WAF0_MYCCR|nr:hypothetical protein [Mycolicibacterium canariasense]MCV7208816.1 hypothetical protein [Mycolicibacterium canariasense]ORV07119.1 hypothetical protein AWB94_14045 [Mycolicibacterium canariasense]GAS94396.1 uncharacterized protein RMCC_1362 [Mycolicibacterium canariasense]
MNRYVLGIDASLVRTGITVLRHIEDGPCRPKVLRYCGYSLENGADWDDRAERIIANTHEVAHIIDRLPAKPELAMIEAPIFPSEVLPSYLDRGALWVGIWSVLKARGITRATVSPTTLKLWVTGSGRADKDMVLDETRKWWPDLTIPNHDVADSAGAAAMCAMKLGWELPFLPRRRHWSGLSTVWPGDIDTAVRATNARLVRR